MAASAPSTPGFVTNRTPRSSLTGYEAEPSKFLRLHKQSRPVERFHAVSRPGDSKFYEGGDVSTNNLSASSVPRSISLHLAGVSPWRSRSPRVSPRGRNIPYWHRSLRRAPFHPGTRPQTALGFGCMYTPPLVA